MARTPMVTRTIITTKVNVLCLELTKAEPFNKVVVLGGTYKDAKSLDKAVHKAIDSDEVKAVHVVDKTEQETLYGMSEQDFIANAKVLDPATRKVVESEDADVQVEAEEDAQAEAEEDAQAEVDEDAQAEAKGKAGKKNK